MKRTLCPPSNGKSMAGVRGRIPVLRKNNVAHLAWHVSVPPASIRKLKDPTRKGCLPRVTERAPCHATRVTLHCSPHSVRWCPQSSQRTQQAHHLRSGCHTDPTLLPRVTQTVLNPPSTLNPKASSTKLHPAPAFPAPTPSPPLTCPPPALPASNPPSA